MSHFGLKDFLDDIGCNLIVGVYGLNVLTPERLSGPISTKSMTWRVSCGYRSWFVSTNIATALYMFLLCLTDGPCLCLMPCSSVPMVSVLYRHKRQVKHIHSAQHFLKVSPEDRAAQTILTLVYILSPLTPSLPFWPSL